MRMRLVAIALLLLSASDAFAAEALSDFSIHVSPYVTFARKPLVRSRTAAIESRLRAALTDALKAQGAKIEFDDPERADLVISMRAAKGHTDMEVEGLDAVVRAGSRTVDTVSVQHVKDYSAWATDVASLLTQSSSVQMVLARIRTERLDRAALGTKDSSGLPPEVVRLVRAQNAVVAALPVSADASALDVAGRSLLEESLRSQLADRLSPLGYTVLTGENTLRVLEENGVDAMKVCEASCALDAARELKAALFVSSSVSLVEGHHVMLVRLFEQKSGRQLSSTQFEARSIRELRDGVLQNVHAMITNGLVAFARLKQEAATTNP